MPDRPEIALPPFTLVGYRRLLTTFLDAGYKAVGFNDVRPDRRDLIMRHDIDLSLEAAVAVAELEAQMGIKATYFVMASSSFYNALSREARPLISRLATLGHHIGLHVDVSLYPSQDILDPNNPAIANESRSLAMVAGELIELVSLHNPGRDLLNRVRPPGGRPHTYEPRFFTDLAYVSDSGGSWRYGGPFERPAFRNGTAIHLLTHPIWWAQDKPTGRPELTLERFAAARGRHVHDNLLRVFKDYRELHNAREQVE